MKREERLLCRTEMRILRWAQGVSLKEHKKNEKVWQQAGIESIEEKLRDARLRWFSHVEARTRISPEKSGQLARTREKEKRKTSKEMDRCGGRGFEKKRDEEGRCERQLLASRSTPK